jgi:hypothetical protein
MAAQDAIDNARACLIACKVRCDELAPQFNDKERELVRRIGIMQDLLFADQVTGRAEGGDCKLFSPAELAMLFFGEQVEPITQESTKGSV